MSAAAAAPIAVVAAGGFSPIGATWVQTCASIRAGVNRFAEHPYYEALTPDPGWDDPDPLRCSLVPGWDETLDEPRRLDDLALEALRDLLARVTLRRGDLPRGGLLLAMPGDGDVRGGRAASEAVVGGLVERTGLDGFALAEARDGGHAAFHLVVREAAARIAAGEIEYCVAGGVDSYFTDARLDALDEGWRLRTGRNPDGFLPGEAAVMLLLATPRVAASLGATPLCALGDVAVATEPAPITGEVASTGRGLAAAIEAAVGGGAAAWVLCDLNGESYRAFEWGLVQTRLGPTLAGTKRLTHPADCAGDVGAATGALLLACVAHAHARRAAPGPALVWASADDGTRVALRVDALPAR